MFCRKRWKDLTWTDSFVLVLGVMLTVALVKALPFSLRINTTDSLPLGLYLQDHRKTPRVGDLVNISAPSPIAYANTTVRVLLSKNRDLLKPVGALTGHYLSTVGNYVWACPHTRGPDRECELLAVGVPFDSKGRPLELWKFDRTPIPNGYAYVGNLRAHPRAFDSRYIGLVPIERNAGVVSPVLVK